MQDNSYTEFEIVGDISNYFNIPNNILTHNTVDAYVDQFFGSDEFGDGSANNPYKNADYAYDQLSHSSSNITNIVIRGNFTISSSDTYTVWIGDDNNSSITYSTTSTFNKAGRYINLTVKNYTVSGSTTFRSFMCNIKGERETSISSNFEYKNYFGLVDTTSKPISEVLMGYRYCILVGNEGTGGNFNCLISGTTSLSNTWGNDNIYFADNTFTYNNNIYDFSSQASNFSDDAEFGNYVNTQLGIEYFEKTSGSSFGLRKHLCRYKFSDIVNYDNVEFSYTLTDFGYQYLSTYYPEIISWMKKPKNIPIYTNSNGQINCFDSNTASGAISVIDNCIFIDENSANSNGSITSKVIELNRRTENIIGICSSLRQLSKFISGSLNLRTVPLYINSSNEIELTQSSDRVSISNYNRNLGVWIASSNTDSTGVDVKVYNTDTYVERRSILYPGDTITLFDDENVTLLTGTKLELHRVINPVQKVGFIFRGTNDTGPSLTSGSLDTGATYIALEQTELSDGRILEVGESIDVTSSLSIVSGKLGCIFGQRASYDYTYYDYETSKVITEVAKSPWIPVENNSKDFGVGRDANGLVYLPNIVTTSKTVWSNSVSIDRIGGSDTDPAFSNGISYKYIQIRLSIQLKEMSEF